MKNLKLIASLALTLAATTALASPPPHARAARYGDYAQVISSTPVYEEFNEPRRECWTEHTGYRYEKEDRSYGGAILGAIVGGVVGHQFGKGSGKDAATAAGAAIGAVTGDNIDNDDRQVRRRPVTEERCRMVDNWSRRITGYDVVYRYHGQRHTTFLPYDPGPTLKVRVAVDVDER
jgi:uncharacterized protein YcfJ